ncbi:MAG: glyoxylate/hydroxypyruvate reductase A [Mesorhizobium amorphae]|nr:MAG: glyoxylate/hydroxypyruvate reductase A [Mesorhizobium amorphae]
MAERILLSLGNLNPRRWFELLSGHREVVLEPDGPEDPSIRFAVVWKYPHGSLKHLPNLQGIFSMGAGVDHIMADPDLPRVPVVRVVDENLTQHMVEYVVWRVMDHHRQGAAYRAQQARGVWHEPPQRTAGDVSVGIMGLGQLGRAAAEAVRSLGFSVNGWSRSPRDVPGVHTFHGENQLVQFLNTTDILVVLLPLTPQTRGIVNSGLLRQLRQRNALGGAVLINAGRGALQSDADIFQALEDGTLKEASLDVFEEEPLPASSPLWTHPRLFLTPHAAATSDPNHLVGPMLEGMARIERGETPDNLVNRAAGY